LTAKTGFTLVGVVANTFTVPGATATNPVNSGVVTAIFPETAATVDALTVDGVTAPVVGAQPVSTVTDTPQYTGTVSWDPAVDPTDGFALDTVYTATITLTAKTGYTLVGVPADAFTVTGATTTNPAGSGTITAVFPATGPPPAPPVDKTALDEALDQARAVEKTHQTQATWDALQDAVQEGAATAADPAATQVEVDAAAQAISDAIAALRYDYPVVVQFPTWAGSGTATAQVDADPAKFVRLTLNGATVPATAYTVTSYTATPGSVAARPLAAGDTAITLHESYLKTLTPGVYSFYAEFTDGSSGPLTITITQSAKPDDPSDPSDPSDPDNALPVTGGQSLPAIALLAAFILISGVLLRTKPRT
jgi:hypothetical protein